MQAISKVKAHDYDLCQSAKINGSYGTFLKENPIPRSDATKLDAGFFKSWPGLTFTISRNFSCTSSSEVSCTEISAEAEDLKAQTDDDWAKLRAKSPEIAGAVAYTLLTNEAVMSLIGYEAMGSAAAASTATVVVLVVAVAIASWQNYETSLRIERLNSYIDRKEREIDEILNGYINSKQYLAKIEAACPQAGTNLHTSITQILGNFRAEEVLEAIDDVLKRVDSSTNWSNQLFYDAVTSKPPLIDELVRQQLVASRLEFYEPIYQSESNQEISAVISSAATDSGDISLVSCRESSPRQAKAELRQLTRRFRDNCIANMEILGKQITVIAQNGSELILKHLGTDPSIKSVKIATKTSGESKIEILADDQTVLYTYENITGSTIRRYDAELVVATSDGTAWNSKMAPLPSGLFELKRDSEIAGYSHESLDMMRDAFDRANRSIRRKLVRCSREFNSPNFQLELQRRSCDVFARGL